MTSHEHPLGANQLGLAQLNERSREIFRRIVESYLATGEPVGSRNLSRILPMTLSPASVRNVMSDLEQLGLVYAPHTSAGRLPMPEGWSLLTASARKWGGPAGVGVLAVRRTTRWREPFPADDREGRRVPGFPNVPEILAAAASLTAVSKERGVVDGALRALVDRIRAAVAELPDTVVHGDPEARLPHIVTYS